MINTKLEVKFFRAVNADTLVNLGVLGIISKPVDGIDRHPGTRWGKIACSTIEITQIGNDLFPVFYLHFKGERRKPTGFALSEDPNQLGAFLISTVSGDQAGRVPLGPEMSAIVGSLIEQSVQIQIESPWADQA